MNANQVTSTVTAMEGKRVWTAPQMQVAKLPVVTKNGPTTNSGDIFTFAS